jgi:Glycosyl hydrolases family 39
MDAERQHPVALSRQTFLKGMAGVVMVAGTRNLWTAGQSASVTVDLSSQTGKAIGPYLYGYASGALLDDNFQLAANKTVEKSAEALAPPLMRFNTPVQNIIQSVFANGVSQPDWAPFSRWVQCHADFLGAGGRLVFGIGPAGEDTSIPKATWAQYAKATARHFQEIGQEITYWEVGNECDPMGAEVYSQYFNAIADALHSVNPAYLVGGPVASWWNGIDLPTFIHHSGTRLGFVDFHSYPVDETDSTQTAYEKAATFADVASARQAVAGTVAASVPIGLLEYNMNGDEQPNGTYGLPAQGTIVGAVYLALLLTQAFASDDQFTMAALWDLVSDSNYGAIGNAQDANAYRAIDEQGRYLSQAARLMPGQQVLASTTTPDLQVLACTNDQSFSIQLVNYQLTGQQSATISLGGGTPSGQITRWELSARYPHGRSTTTASLTRVPLPPQSIVILGADWQA